MTSSLTSHATIGSSTFAEPHSVDSTMSSIDGPSDFTENMLDYMKGTKKPAAKIATRVKSKVKPMRRRYLKEDESGIIIDSPSEFGDDDSTNDVLPKIKEATMPPKPTVEDVVDDSKLSSQPLAIVVPADRLTERAPTPVKTNASFVIDGPSDFTENLVDYLKGTKAYSPQTTRSSSATTTAVSKSTQTLQASSPGQEEVDLRRQIAQLQAQLLQKDDTINSLQSSLTIAEGKVGELESELEQKDRTIHNLSTEHDTIKDRQTSLTFAQKNSAALESKLEQRNTTITQLQTSLKQSIQQCKDQAHLASENTKLEASISCLHRQQEKMEARSAEREEEWHARADLLLQEIDRRGKACLQLWGQLENPGERDERGRQGYTYKFVKKSAKGAVKK